MTFVILTFIINYLKYFHSVVKKGLRFVIFEVSFPEVLKIKVFLDDISTVLLLPLALQPTVGFGLSKKILPFFPISHQLFPSSLNPSSFFLFSTFVTISFFTVWGC
jgi:hypothetical protein